MKRLLNLLSLFAILAFALTACSGSNIGGDEGEPIDGDEGKGELRIELRLDGEIVGSAINLYRGEDVTLKARITSEARATQRLATDASQRGDFGWIFEAQPYDSSVQNGVIRIGVNETNSQLRLNVIEITSGLTTYVEINVITPIIELRLNNGGIVGEEVSVDIGRTLEFEARLVSRAGGVLIDDEFTWLLNETQLDPATVIVDGLLTIGANETQTTLFMIVRSIVHEIETFVQINVVTPRIELTLDGSVIESQVTLSRGDTRTFGARLVSGVDGANLGGNFVWTLGGFPTSSEVTNGVIRIGTDEERTQLQLIVADEISGLTRNVNLTIVPPTIQIPTTPHATFTDPDTGIVWRVLQPPTPGNGNRALIITQYTHLPNVQYHSVQGFTPFVVSNVRTAINSWFNNAMNVGPILRSMALDYEFQDAEGNSISRHSTATGVGIEVNREQGSNSPNVSANANLRRALTRPVPNSNATAQPFLLSTSEANQHFGNNTTRVALSAANRTSLASWWLRSPSSGGGLWQSTRHAIVATNGQILAANATHYGSAGAIRPALWVQVTPTGVTLEANE